MKVHNTWWMRLFVITYVLLWWCCQFDPYLPYLKRPMCTDFTIYLWLLQRHWCTLRKVWAWIFCQIRSSVIWIPNIFICQWLPDILILRRYDECTTPFHFNSEHIWCWHNYLVCSGLCYTTLWISIFTRTSYPLYYVNIVHEKSNLALLVWGKLYYNDNTLTESNFLHAAPWISGGGKSILMVVTH